MLPFLLIATRVDDAVADAEYEQFLRFGGLSDNQLHRHRLEAESLPEIDLTHYSGVIVGGSPFTGSIPIPEKSETQLRVELEIATLLNQLVERDFPFLGACYGVGTLARHQGGTIDTTYGEEAGVITVKVTEEGLQDPLLEGMGHAFDAIVGHKEACSVLPSNAVLLATSDACPVQMFKVKNNLYGTQFHPELDPPGLADRLRAYRNNGYIDPDKMESVIDSVLASDVTVSHTIIKNFVERYAR